MSDWFQIGDTFGSTNTTTALSSNGSIMVVGTPDLEYNGQVNVYQKPVVVCTYNEILYYCSHLKQLCFYQSLECFLSRNLLFKKI